MPHPARDTTTYTGNRADGDSTNIYANVYGDVHFPERPREAGEPSPHQCLRDLRVTDPREDRARIEGEKDKLLRDCYAWILEDDSYQQWRTQDESRLLWIKGDPGKGKTMMTMGAIAELSQADRARPPPKTMSKMLAKLKRSSKQEAKRASRQRLVSYFFCQNTRPELNNAASVLRGLIYLLIAQREEPIRHVQQRYETVGKQWFEGPNAVYALKEVLSDILNDGSLPTTYLLVDALDECTSGLSELLHIITDASLGRRSRVKWLVTSRNIPEIEQYLQPDSLGVKVSLEVKTAHVTRAVAAFVHYKVQRLAAVQKYEPRLQAEVQQQLRDKAEGTFLWVSLVCKELGKVPHYRTLEVLGALPPGLSPLYERMMVHIKAQDAKTVGYCKDVLRTITFAFRSLQLSELALSADLPCDRFGDAEAVIDLVSRCGSFLTVREGVVSFIHLSVKDYFTIGDGRQVFDSTSAQEHKHMADRLLDAMDSVLRRDVCGLQKPGARTLDGSTQGRIKNSNLPQIAYACEYWVDHVQAGKQSCSSMLAEGGKVHGFFQKHLLHWLEAMSLLQKMAEAILALHKLNEAINGVESTTVSKVVHDAVRFAMWSGSGVQEAPLQVYYSALVFAPEQIIVRRQFGHELPKDIAVKSGLDKDWGPLLQTLEGHTSGVSSVAFSPAGDRLASASDDKTVRVWDAQTGRPLRTLKGHTSKVTSVTFLAAGDRLASASWDRTIQVWDVQTGQALYVLAGHIGWVTSVISPPTGDRLASASRDQTVQIWDASTQRPLHTLKGHTISVSSVAFSTAGDRLASASQDRTVRVWDAKTGQPLHTLKGHADVVNSVVFLHTGDRLASASDDKTVRVWDVQTGQPLHLLKGHTDIVTSVAFSATGDRLASASGDRMVRIWDAKTGHPLHILEGHTKTVTSVAFSPTGDRLASTSQDWTVRIWDMKVAQPLHAREGHTSCVTSLAFSVAGDRFASASRDRTVRVWDAKTGQPLHTLKGHIDVVSSVIFSPTGAQLASVSTKTVRVWNAKTGQPLHVLIGHTDSVTSLAFSIVGDRLAVASNKTVQVWDTNNGQLLRTFMGHTDQVHGLGFSRAGDSLASSSWDETVRVWDLQTRQLLHTLKGHTDVVPDAAFSAVGDRLASASWDKTVRVWDAKTGQPLHTLEGHTQNVSSVAFSAEGDRLASASWDKTVRVWDAKTGLPLHTFERVGWVSSMAFSRDGSRLLTDKGTLLFPQPTLSVFAPSPQASVKTVIVAERWLTVNAEDVLWIPADCKPSCTAVHSCNVAFGYNSGRVLLLAIT